jgi:hypothetical protein
MEHQRKLKSCLLYAPVRFLNWAKLSMNRARAEEVM